MLPINILPPAIILRNLGKRAKERRLAENFSRKTLAARAGVSDGTLKRFESTGRVSTQNLIALAIALDCADEMELLFRPRPIRTIEDVQVKLRARGRR